MLEKHIQLMHGIKDPDVKELTEGSNEEETVPRVWPLLHVPRLPVQAPLHRPQAEGASARVQAERGWGRQPARE